MSRTETAGKCLTRASRPYSGRSHGRDVRVAGIAFFRLISALAAGLLIVAGEVRAAEPRKLVFDGVLCEHRLALRDIDSSMPSNWTGYTHLVMEMRTSTPQRFGLWVYTAEGPRRIELQPFGQNVWLRASVPLQYFKGMDQSGNRSGLDQQPPHQFLLDVGLGTVRRSDVGRIDWLRDAVSDQ
jgi:hypothetical protein